LSPIGSIDPVAQTRFINGLVSLRGHQGLYREDPKGVTISEQVLYQARIALPSNVQTGRYTAETFAIAHGQVVASASAEVDVHKRGFERLVADYSQEHSFLYGLFAVALSLLMGWLAHRLFAFI
jgi:uncharacterized protein (TIGR02186 family)